jgi:hypothetical protein
VSSHSLQRDVLGRSPGVSELASVRLVAVAGAVAAALSEAVGVPK